MKFVIVDTSVWSKVLRKKQFTEDEDKLVQFLGRIIRELFPLFEKLNLYPLYPPLYKHYRYKCS